MTGPALVVMCALLLWDCPAVAQPVPPAVGGDVVSVRATGAAGDGAADDTAALQKAIDQVRGRGGTVYLPVGTYRVSSLDLTNIGHGFALVGEGPNASRLMPCKDGVAVLDLTGSRFVKLEGFQVGAYNQEACPSVGILLAQVASGVANAVHFQRLCITGKYSVASLYCYGVPSSTAVDCDFYNYLDGDVPTVMFTHNNRKKVSSAFAEMAPGNWSTSDWTWVGCEIHEYARPSGKTRATALWLDGTMQMRWVGGNISGAGPQLVRLSEKPRYTLFEGTTLYSENGTPAEAVFFADDRVEGLSVTQCLPQASRAIFAGAPGAAYDEVQFAGKPTANGFSGLLADCPGGSIRNAVLFCDGLGLKVKSIADSMLINPGTVTAETNTALTVDGGSGGKR